MNFIIMDKENKYEEEAELLKTLGHPIRLKIIEILINNQSCVRNIWVNLGLPQATVSQHLVSLKNKGIVSCKRDGVMMCYKLNDKIIEKIFNTVKGYKRKTVHNNSRDEEAEPQTPVSSKLPL